MSHDQKSDVFARLYKATGCSTQVELAKILGIGQSSISDAKRRGSIPSEWLVKLLERRRINPEWIIYGEGSVLLDPVEETEGRPHVIKIVEVRPPENCSSQELINELVRRALREPKF